MRKEISEAIDELEEAARAVERCETNFAARPATRSAHVILELAIANATIARTNLEHEIEQSRRLKRWWR